MYFLERGWGYDGKIYWFGDFASEIKVQDPNIC